jgi:hypothetical protein
MYSHQLLCGKRAVCFLLFFSVCAAFAFTQEAVSLGSAIRKAADYLNGQLEAGGKIAVLNIESAWPEVSTYIIDELNRNIVNDRRYVSVVRNRDQLAELRGELRFQESGMVSDESAKQIGRMIGAEIIMQGSFTPLGGNRFSLRIQALDVETAVVRGAASFEVYTDSRLAGLLSGKGQKGVSPLWFLWNGDESWKHKWLYPGARAGWSLRRYALNSTVSGLQADAFSTFEAAALLEARIFSHFALQTEIVFSNDKVSATIGDNGITLSSWTAAVPVLAKLTWRPGNFYLAAFAGPKQKRRWK